MRLIDFNIDTNEIELVPLADLHIGSPEADMELIKETCEYIANKPSCYTILNGDLMDNNIRNSIGNGVFEQTKSPLDQVVTAAYYLQDIAKQKKIIAMTSGNHEMRTARETGLSLSDLLLAKLMNYDETLNERYCTDGAFIFLNMKERSSHDKWQGRQCITIFALHGNGGGTKIGNKIQRLDDMSQIVPANIYIRSHTHQPETHRGVYFDVNVNVKTVKEQPCIYLNTGSYLKYGGYGARNGMKPLSRGIPVVTIKIKRKVIKGRDTYQRQIECVIKEHLGD